MRVEFTNLGLEPLEKSKPGRPGHAATAASPPVASESASESSGPDRASFSFDRARVASLEAQALAAPKMRSEKVAALQQAVGNGDYAVDAGKVADAMAAELGGKIG